MWAGRRDVALTDDANQYLRAAQIYKVWYARAWQTIRHGGGDAFDQRVIDRYFEVNNVHPPVAKALMAAGIGLLHDRLGWLDEIDAARVAIMALSTLTAALVFLLCWPVYGPVVALAAPLFLLTMPRFFFDSHVESLDVASAATYFVAVFCAWHGRRRTSWAIVAGMAAGVAMATKINGAFVVLPLLLFWLRDVFRTRLAATTRAARLQDPPAVVMSMVVLGPVVAILLWPWLWGDTVPRLIAYLRFYAHHHPTLFYYFGTIYYVPFAPWHAPIVMAAITTPVPTLLCAVAGAFVMARRLARASAADVERRDLDVLVLLNAVVTIGSVMLPNIPKYGGVKLFLPFFPFLAIVAAIGLDAALATVLVRTGRAPRARAVVTAISFAVLFGAMASRIVAIHPYELSYYNALVGGLPGAERHGFDIQYYDLWYLDVARWLNQTYPHGVRVFFEPNNAEYRRHAPWYYDTGRLNRNVVITADEAGAEVIVLTHEMRWPQYPAIRERFRHRTPLHEVAVEGVPLLSVYDTGSTPARGGAGW